MDNPLELDLRDAFPEDIFSQQFQTETWKHSPYSDVTFCSSMAHLGLQGLGTPELQSPRTQGLRVLSPPPGLHRASSGLAWTTYKALPQKVEMEFHGGALSTGACVGFRYGQWVGGAGIFS